MYTPFIILAVVALLVVLYGIRVELAYYVCKKHTDWISKTTMKKILQGDEGAYAWGDRQYAAMPGFNAMLVDLRKWSYNGWFKGDK